MTSGLSLQDGDPTSDPTVTGNLVLPSSGLLLGVVLDLRQHQLPAWGMTVSLDLQEDLEQLQDTNQRRWVSL